MSYSIPAVLTIAGSDSSGGAGIQADLKTMEEHGVFGMSAITALTAQNTQGVQGIFEISPEFVQEQIDSVFSDIPPTVVKIGMVSSPEIVQVIAQSLEKYQPQYVVLDPVMVAEAGGTLMKSEAIQKVQDLLFPLATIVTPNTREASSLTGLPVNTVDDMIAAAQKLQNKTSGAILVKGGHVEGDAVDVLLEGDMVTKLTARRISNSNTHGTGCTLASAIASQLALGKSLREAVTLSKEYVWGAINAGLVMGKGHGPLDHGYKHRNQ